jgi:hypothetical protein
MHFSYELRYVKILRKVYFAGTENTSIYRVTFCYHFDTTDTNFFESSPKKCQLLGQRGIMKKIIGRA